jgi:hypothetical protein
VMDLDVLHILNVNQELVMVDSVQCALMKQAQVIQCSVTTNLVLMIMTVFLKLV